MLAMLIDDLAPWLATEYCAVHGEKASREDATARAAGH
jgi:hypothetical protein